MSEGDFSFEGRFLVPLGILAIAIFAVITYVVEQNDGIVGIDNYGSIHDNRWQINLAKGDRSATFSARCFSYSVSNMDYSAVSLERRNPKTDAWITLSSGIAPRTRDKHDFRFRAKRTVTIVGEGLWNKRPSCGKQWPLFHNVLHGEYESASAGAAQEYQVSRSRPVFIDISSVRCLYHEKDDGVFSQRMTTRFGTKPAMAFYTNETTRKSVTVWATNEACNNRNRRPPKVTKPGQGTLSLTKRDRYEIQRRLTLAGYNTRGVDGVFGRGTRSAISSWQKSKGFAETGELSANQLRALRSQTETAYGRFLKSGKAAKAEPSRNTTKREAPTGRYIDGAGCMREANGQIVRGYKKECY